MGKKQFTPKEEASGRVEDAISQLKDVKYYLENINGDPDTLQEENEKLEEKIRELERERDDLKDQIIGLEKENKNLRWLSSESDEYDGDIICDDNSNNNYQIPGHI